jgi:hypothetical protein
MDMVGDLTISVPDDDSGENPPWYDSHVELTGLTMSLVTPERLEDELSDEDLPGVRSIKVRISRGFSPVTIELQAQKSSEGPGLVLTVMGSERTTVEGISTRLAALLDRGNQISSSRVQAIALTVGVTELGLVVYLLTRFHLVRGDSSSPLGTALLVVAILVAFAMVPLSKWLTPNLELVSPGVRTRARRFRAWILGALSAFMLGLAASALAALLVGK